ncbi:hypothetical protein RCO27_13745 [Sphingosinicella sp. LHD-64]|uniref:hypothetical protein n=1 Tax=Sphingosinicella sp. LHD-64 TaxID=3072139 RepID=UPI00280ED4F8|nr:hypothetical protein [Sphingosinicella sp. LHD-64]MDQ8757289.1 hypothetical protein [Sphingosinicella sp. LHD-64]
MRLLAVAVAFLITPIDAVGAQRASFRMPGIEFELPIPAGYCLPQGAQADAAQLLAAADSLNVTHLTLVRCEESPEAATDYNLIKTPRQALLTTIERRAFLDSVGEAFATTELTQLMESGSLNSQSEEGISQVIGRQIDISGSIRPLGRDQVCAYVGGTVQMQSNEVSYDISMGACMTIVSSRLLFIYAYGPASGSAGVARLMVRARRLAESISETSSR